MNSAFFVAGHLQERDFARGAEDKHEFNVGLVLQEDEHGLLMEKTGVAEEGAVGIGGIPLRFNRIARAVHHGAIMPDQ